MEIWPLNLPQEQFEPVTYQPQEGTIRSSMDKGPDKVRKRFTATVKKVTLRMYLTGEQHAIFWDWFENDINYGSNPFQWEDPITDETVLYRFRAANPEFALRKGQGSQNKRLWVGTLELEILPGTSNE